METISSASFFSYLFGQPHTASCFPGLVLAAGKDGFQHFLPTASGWAESGRSLNRLKVFHRIHFQIQKDQKVIEGQTGWQLVWICWFWANSAFILIDGPSEEFSWQCQCCFMWFLGGTHINTFELILALPFCDFGWSMPVKDILSS